MTATADRVLVLAEDAELLDFIAEQTLAPAGYTVRVAQTGSTALQLALTYQPDLIITDLHLAGLSGKDLLMAFRAQGINTPFVVLLDGQLNQADLGVLRLGAADYLIKPLREAEMVASVDRCLQTVRLQRVQQQLTQELTVSQDALAKSQQIVLTFARLAHLLPNVAQGQVALQQVLVLGLTLLQAERAWFATPAEIKGKFQLAAAVEPPSWDSAGYWNSGLESMVMLAERPLALAGSSLRQLPVNAYAQAALAAPVTVKAQLIGVLVLTRQSPVPFDRQALDVVRTLADYLAMVTVNQHLFAAVDNLTARAKTQPPADLRRLGLILRNPLQEILEQLDIMLGGEVGNITRDQQDVLTTARQRLEATHELAETLAVDGRFDESLVL